MIKKLAECKTDLSTQYVVANYVNCLTRNNDKCELVAAFINMLLNI